MERVIVLRIRGTMLEISTTGLSGPGPIIYWERQLDIAALNDKQNKTNLSCELGQKLQTPPLFYFNNATK